MKFFLVLTALGFLTISMIGCDSGYKLQGRVIAGANPAVAIVDADDPRLKGYDGIPNASVMLTLDPRSLGRKSIGNGVTDIDGHFSIPIDEFGAGFLEHEVAILGRAGGYVGTEETIILPPSRRRVLIVLPPGRDRHQPRYTPADDLDRFNMR